MKLPKVAFINNKDVLPTSAVAGISDSKVANENHSEVTVKYALDLLAPSAVPVTASHTVNILNVNRPSHGKLKLVNLC